MHIKKAEDIKLHLEWLHPKVIIPETLHVQNIIASTKDENNRLMFMVNDGNGTKYYPEDLICYDPAYDGAVTAVRIYNKDGYNPTADLAFAFGGMITIEWDRCDLREIFMPGINAYTLMYDTRCVRPFTDWVKPKED